MNNTTHMAGLVDNALDFLDRAFNELQASPKYSVIHFYAAVELFLKARLMAEHWSLVIAKPQEADQAKFLKGDFQSATLDDAIRRLERIVGSGLNPAEAQQVQRLGRHRNQTMHFYHEATGQAGEELRREVAMEQLRAWHTLNRLLLDKWGDVFKPWADRIHRLNEALKGHRDYLQVRYEAIKSDLAKEEKKGARIAPCFACGHEANAILPIFGFLGSAQCLVCDAACIQVEAKCPGCGTAMTFMDEGFQTCASCGREVGADELATIIQDDEPGTKDYHEHGLPGHCTGCGGIKTVVRHDGNLLCASCFIIWNEESMGQCAWCGDVNAGKLEDSFLTGCTVCDGRFGSGSME